MKGRTICQYRVTAKIGEGGMGVVYKAEDTLLRRPVALKFLSPEHANDDERIERFLREARSASALNHPNIVTVYNVVREESTICIVMEYVEGSTLEKLMPSSGFTAREALGYAVQIADALTAAHDARIIHRDIKPGNVMVTPSGTVKVLDFGLAKLAPSGAVDPDERTETQMTHAGLIVGTPAYMSPEQVLGSPIDPRSDIFSFGATLYESLTGARPFRATESTSLLHAIVNERETPITDLREDLSPVLQAIISKSLEKDRDARFQTMSEMRVVLHRLLKTLEAGEVPRLEHQELPGDGSDNRSPKRWLWAVGGTIVVVTIASALWVGLGFRESSQGVGPEQVAAVEPETAFEFVQRGNRLLEHFYRTGYVDQAVESFQSALALEPESASAYAGLAKAYRRKYRREKDPEMLTRAEATIDEAVRLDEHLMTAQVTRSLIQLTAGEKETARAGLEEVLRLDPDNAEALLALGDCHRGDGAVNAAEAAYRRGIELEPENYRHWQALGILYYRNARYADAEASFARTAELAPDLVGAFRNLAAVQHLQGKYGAAAANLQKALEIKPDPRTYNNLGTLYFYQGLYQKSLTAFEKAVQGGSHDYRFWGNLGDAYRWTAGNEEKAQAAFETAIRLVRAAIADTGPDAEKRGLLAEYLAKIGEADAALSEIEGFEASDPYDLFNAAQAAEIGGARDLSLELLGQALGAGLSLEEVRKDPELAELRQDPRLQLLLTRAEARARSDER